MDRALKVLHKLIANSLLLWIFKDNSDICMDLLENNWSTNRWSFSPFWSIITWWSHQTLVGPSGWSNVVSRGVAQNTGPYASSLVIMLTPPWIILSSSYFKCFGNIQLSCHCWPLKAVADLWEIKERRWYQTWPAIWHEKGGLKYCSNSVLPATFTAPECGMIASVETARWLWL